MCWGSRKRQALGTIAGMLSCAHRVLPVLALAACATTPFQQPAEFRGSSAVMPPQRDEVLWALQPYAAAASGCNAPITGIDAQRKAGAPNAAGVAPLQRELWIVYLCDAAFPVHVTLRPQDDGRFVFAFDTRP